jgi:YVTN family beta-propeller protein
VSTIDVKTRTRHARDIAVGTTPGFIVTGVAVTPDGKTVFVNNSNLAVGVAPGLNLTVSTIDVKTRTKNPADITVGSFPTATAFTPDGKTAFVINTGSNSVSTIDVKTRTKDPTDIAVGSFPLGVAITPDGKTAFVANAMSNSVSTIDVKTRTKNPDDIAVGSFPSGVAITPNGKTVFVANTNLAEGRSPTSDTLSTVDVKTRIKDPTDIPVGAMPVAVAVSPDGKSAYVPNLGSSTVSTVDVKTRTKDPTDIPVGAMPWQVAFTPCRR